MLGRVLRLFHGGRSHQSSIQQYQGEVLDKVELQDKFAEKLRICQLSPTRVTEFDWEGVRAILDCLRTAFANP